MILDRGAVLGTSSYLISGVISTQIIRVAYLYNMCYYALASANRF